MRYNSADVLRIYKLRRAQSEKTNFQLFLFFDSYPDFIVAFPGNGGQRRKIIV